MQHWKPLGPVFLVAKRENGTANRYKFNSLDSLVKTINYDSFIAITDCENLYFKPRIVVVVGCSILNNHPRGAGWLGTIYVEDECGLTVPRWKINELAPLRQKRENLRFRRIQKHSFEFRKDPVPRTGKRRWLFGSFYKTPKTYQELRNNYLDEDAIYYGIRIRPNRNKNYLKTAWDDRPRSDIKTRENWKKRRRHQWKDS